MRKRGGYGRHFFNRLGWLPKPKQPSTIWIQAVSVGEIESLRPLLVALKQRNIPVYLTTTTSTAFRIVEKKYVSLVDTFGYFPLDLWLFSALAWWRIRPKAILLTESELWPEHLFQAKKHSVPVYLINGRLSDRTFSRYQRFLPIARVLFGFLTKVFAASHADAKRFQVLCPKNIPIIQAGNLKIDAAAQSTTTPVSVARSELGDQWKNTTVLLGASTWSGEEKMLVEFFLKARKEFPQLRLILVPRHVERTHEVKVLLQSYPITFCFRTQPTKNADIYVVNTTGELRSFLPTADLVFIGKSFPPHYGGQTPIEAAVCGKPIVYGSHMENFVDICTDLEHLHAAVRCTDIEHLEQQLLFWLKHPEDATACGQAAQKWVHTHQGAVKVIMDDLFR
jgi:3-deoxy-D-manno-octulosonic-acid transferase